jgi:carbonic anhydrase
MEAASQIQRANRVWAEAHFAGSAPRTPARHLVVVTCMDSRIDVFGAFGLTNGQAHIVRNAGGLVTEDVLRSIALSQRKLGTVDVVIVQHTDCGMHRFDDDTFRAELVAETGVAPHWDVAGFDDIDESVRGQIRAVVDCPWLAAPGGVAGFVYDVDTGLLRLISETPDRA